jgi:hypothetical protein
MVSLPPFPNAALALVPLAGDAFWRPSSSIVRPATTVIILPLAPTFLSMRPFPMSDNTSAAPTPNVPASSIGPAFPESTFPEFYQANYGDLVGTIAAVLLSISAPLSPT